MNTIRFTTVIFLLGCCSTLQAQFKDRLSLGPRAGINISNINQSQAKAIIGLNAGITATYSINQSSGITLDVLYSEEGYELPTTVVDYTYLQFPLMYNTFFGLLGQPFRPKIYAGLAPALLLSAKANQMDFKDQNEMWAINFVGGLGFNYRLVSRLWLNADARLLLGLTDIEVNPSSADPFRNKTFHLSLGIAYGF